MTSKTLLEAIGLIDDDLIHAAVKNPPKKVAATWIRFVALAACLTLVLGSLLWLSHPQPSPSVDSDPLTVYPAACLSAADAAMVFPIGNDTTATSTYQTVYLPTGKSPQHRPLPTADQLNIYTFTSLPMPLSETELQALEVTVLPKLTAALGISPDISQRKEHFNANRLEIHHQYANTHIGFEQNNGENQHAIVFNQNRVVVFNNHSGELITLNGRPLHVNRQQTEEEILSSLQWARDILFDVFGLTFDTAEVTVSYDEYHDGAWSVHVDYYNKSSINTNDSCRFSDHLSLQFKALNNDTAPLGSEYLTDCTITYTAYRRPVTDHTTVESGNRVTLEEAEAFLKKGYVFGGYTCTWCMAQQEAVTFDSYDYVSLEYVTGLYNSPARSIPFYAFYKAIGTTENGYTMYAKTYVCAIELSDLDDYFANQADKHKHSDNQS